MVSMSLGFTSDRLASMPSTRTRDEPPEPMLLVVPRMDRFAPWFGLPSANSSVRPGIWPWIERTTFGFGRSVRSSPPICSIAPTTSRFFNVPYPTTTTSSSINLSSAICTLITLRLPTVSSFVTKPRTEKIIVSPDAALIEYLPDSSDIVPESDPLTITMTPAIGTPRSSTIVPDTEWPCWARARLPAENSRRTATAAFQIRVFILEWLIMISRISDYLLILHNRLSVFSKLIKNT